jgi:hypothetical protein
VLNGSEYPEQPERLHKARVEFDRRDAGTGRGKKVLRSALADPGEIFGRIYRNIALPDLVVQVRPGCSPGFPYGTDDFTARDVLAHLYVDALQVTVPSGHAEFVIQNNHVPIACALAREDNDGVCRGDDRFSLGS